MTFDRKSSGSNVALTTFKRRASGAWVTLTTGKRRLSGAWVDILPSTLGATLTTTTITGTGDTTLPQHAFARFEINPDGWAYKTETDGIGGSARVQIFQWLTGGGAAADYEAIATTDAGTAGSGTIGTAVNLGSTQSWTRNRIGTVGTTTWTIGVTIQPAGGGSALAGPTQMGLVANNPT